MITQESVSFGIDIVLGTAKLGGTRLSLLSLGASSC